METLTNQINHRNSSIWVIWAFLVIFFFAASIISFTVTAEDAYISFRYAENIAGGFGPVFNRGGEVVEGYSNPLWVALLVISGAKYGYTETVARILGLLFGALILLEVILILQFIRPDKIELSVFACLIIACSPSFLFWSQSGLETSLYIYLLLLSWRLVLIETLNENQKLTSFIPLILLALTRPEGIIFFIVLAAWRAWLSLRTKKVIDRKLVTWSLWVIAAFVVFLVVRKLVFNEWLPNTFYAKVNNGFIWKAKVGASYILSFLQRTSGIPLLAFIGTWIIGGRKFNDNSKAFLLSGLLIILAQIIFILYVGGDIHPNDRFILPALIVTVLLSFAQIPGTVKNSKFGLLQYALFVLLMLGNIIYYSYPGKIDNKSYTGGRLNFLSSNVVNLFNGRIQITELWQGFLVPRYDALDLVGLDLAKDNTINGFLATDQCGKIPYRSKHKTLDLFGLNNPAIAHIIHSNKTWDIYARHVLESDPQLFVVFYRDGHLVSKYYLENTILSEPFKKRYELDSIYHVDYEFLDAKGKKNQFANELLCFRKKKWHKGSVKLTDEELVWLKENQPIIDTPGALEEMIDSFISENANRKDKIKRFIVELN